MFSEQAHQSNGTTCQWVWLVGVAYLGTTPRIIKEDFLVLFPMMRCFILLYMTCNPLTCPCMCPHVHVSHHRHVEGSIPSPHESWGTYVRCVHLLLDFVIASHASKRCTQFIHTFHESMTCPPDPSACQ